MKSNHCLTLKSLLVHGSACSLLLSSAYAANATWTGAANTNLGNGANWSSGSATFVANDTATWDNTKTGNQTLTWNSGSIGPSSGNGGGLNLNITGANISSLQLDGTTAGLRLGVGQVTIASGAGAFTLGDGSGTSEVVYRNPSTTWTNDSSNTATVKSDVSFLNGGGVGNRNVTITGEGNWQFETAVIGTGFGGSQSTATLTKNGNGTLTLAAANAHGAGTILNAGVLAVTHGSGLGTGNLTINGSFGTRLEVSNNIALSGPTTINLTGRNNTPDTTASGAAIRNLSGNNSIASNLVFANVGGTHVNILSTAGTLTLGGNISTTLGTGRIFNFTGDGNIASTGVISNGTSSVGVTKTGTGILTLSGVNTYSGNTTVSGGTLVISGAGSINNTSSIILNGGTFKNNSSVALTPGLLTFTSGTISGTNFSGTTLSIGAGQTVSPGNSPGTLTAGSTTFNGSGNYNWQVLAANGVAGTGFDTMTLDSGATLTIGSTSADKFNINLWSLSSIGPDVNGNASAFVDTNSYSWTIVATNQAIAGFAADKFSINTSALNGTGGFSNAFTGAFSVVLGDSGTDLVLSYAAIPEPSTYAILAGVSALGLVAYRRRRNKSASK
ncbi:MAG: hypothetical protein RIQ79_1427 [Verrucomicrobiota bacterium]